MLTKIFILLMAINNIESGYVSGYHQTPTDATLQYRIESGENFQHKYNVAVLNCDHVGKEGIVFFDGQAIPVNIFDCAGKADGGYDWMIENNIVMEVGWYLWQDYPGIIHNQADIIIFD